MREFATLPLSVHRVLENVPLHDVWAVDLPCYRPGITLAEFLEHARKQPQRLSPAARALLQVRFFLGWCFGWDKTASGSTGSTFSNRLTEADRAGSRVSPGSKEGMFRTVYFFENEKLSEIANRTVQAAALRALVETEGGYRFYLAVYVRSVGWWTALYMAIIDPFRRYVIYPSMLRQIHSHWDRIFAPSVR